MHPLKRFSSPQGVNLTLGEKRYFASDEISTIMSLSLQLGKPLLAESPAGVDKTELAKAVDCLLSV